MARTPLNILYVVCHDLGRELGCYGAGVATPNLDRFAAGGVQFSRAYCASPACSPSRGCAMTGMYAHTNGLMGLVNRGWTLPLSTRTIVDHLNDAGYETVHSGLQHERHRKEDNRYRREIEASVFAEDAIGSAIHYLEERAAAPQGRPPFYLNIGTIETHESRWNSRDRFGRVAVYDPGPPEEAYVPPFLPDVPPIRREMTHFQASIRYLDREIARLFEAVERLGYGDNTLVVFTTDHGISAHRAKGTLYGHGLEIALLMRGPGLPAGRQINHLISNIDVCPMLLEAVGAPIPPQVQGRSFWPLLRGGDYQPHEALFFERNYHGGVPTDQPAPEPRLNPGYDPMRAVRTDRFHYIRNVGENQKRHWLPEQVTVVNETFQSWYTELWPPPTLPRPREELFDVPSDPHETRDLADEPEFADVKAGLGARLDRWMEATDDPIRRGPIPDRLNTWIVPGEKSNPSHA
jgi:arylsulfatase A-like enzyme